LRWLRRILEVQPADELKVSVSAGAGDRSEAARSGRPCRRDVGKGGMIGNVEAVDLKDESQSLGSEVDRASNARIDIPRIRGGEIIGCSPGCRTDLAQAVRRGPEFSRCHKGVRVDVLCHGEIRGCDALAVFAVDAWVAGEVRIQVRFALAGKHRGAATVRDRQRRSGDVGIDAGELPAARQSANKEVVSAQMPFAEGKFVDTIDCDVLGDVVERK